MFKVKKNGVFLFGISFFIIEIFTFLLYANEESVDVIGGSTKTEQHSMKNISRNITVVYFKFGNRNVHHKRKEMTPVVPLPWQLLCCWSCFIKTKIPHDFLLNKDHSPPTICWGELRQYENHVYSEQDPVSHFKGLQITCPKERLHEVFMGFTQGISFKKTV